MGHTFGVRVDGAVPRGFSGFVSLTGRWPEGCGLPYGAQRTHFEGAIATRKM